MLTPMLLEEEPVAVCTIASLCHPFSCTSSFNFFVLNPDFGDSTSQSLKVRDDSPFLKVEGVQLPPVALALPFSYATVFVLA